MNPTEHFIESISDENIKKAVLDAFYALRYNKTEFGIVCSSCGEIIDLKDLNN